MDVMKYYSAIKKEQKLGICNNMDGSREYNTKWINSAKERQIQYDFMHMWILRNKTVSKEKKNRERKTNQETLLITENKLRATREEVGGGMGEIGEGD